MSTTENVASWIAVNIEEAGGRAGIHLDKFEADTTSVDGYSIIRVSCELEVAAKVMKVAAATVKRALKSGTVQANALPLIQFAVVGD